MIELGTTVCGRFETSSSRESLETNGIGGYASSSVSGANTRRYHGLLVAATRPPQRRIDEMLAGFRSHLTDAMVGQVSEIFEGDASRAERLCRPGMERRRITPCLLREQR